MKLVKSNRILIANRILDYFDKETIENYLYKKKVVERDFLLANYEPNKDIKQFQLENEYNIVAEHHLKQHFVNNFIDGLLND